MSGASLPYALRQNKFVDRRIFIDLLSRLERYVPLDDHVYISMGGATLEDHRLAHAVIGMKRLVSFDNTDWVVKRQAFNRPVDYVKIIKKQSSDLIANFSSEMRSLGFGGAPNAAIWLDYTKPSQLGVQVRELHQLLDILQPHDVVRITVNASSSAIYSPRIVDEKLEPASVFRPIRLSKLSDRLNDYMPEGVTAEEMTDDGLPSVIARAIQKAVKAAFPADNDSVAMPLSIVKYNDGQQMLSCTLFIIERSQIEQFLARAKPEEWPFYSKDWEDIHEISVPDLTLRERLFINERIPTKTPIEVSNDLGFHFDGDAPSAEKYITQYQKYYRFYPQFHHVTF